MTLWAAAITAGRRGMSVGLIAAAYPTIPFLASTAVEVVTPAGTRARPCLRRPVAGGLACVWFVSMRAPGCRSGRRPQRPCC